MSQCHGRRRDDGTIYVVVVESHQHVLEHIHSILRQRRALKSWSMLHFDAHPDLACPNVPAMSCFNPRHECDEKDLYERLDATSSGIAEWILPLVLAGGLSHVHWIKPPESGQIPQGQHEYHVGAWIPQSEERPVVSSFLDLPASARVRVDWNHSYYLDDASVVPIDELQLAKKLNLTVSNVPTGDEMSPEKEQSQLDHSEEAPTMFHDNWLLDICLDYFACLNPFLTDIEAIDPAFAQALINMVTSTCLHDGANNEVILEPSRYERDLLDFRTHLRNLLQEKGGDSMIKLLRFYESNEHGRLLMQELLHFLTSSPDPATLTTLAVEAISNLSMPHDPKDSLPALEESVSQRLEYVSLKLRCTRKKHGNPFLITIARSTNDGFTPSSIVEKSQTQVISSVHETFCGCDLIHELGDASLSPENLPAMDASDHPCRLRIIFDYAEWEGSFIL